MTSRSDTAYFARRETEERARAMACSDVAARRVHLEMAERYRECIQSAMVAPAETICA
ncbi:hypothetical protein [Sphingomonas qomolangmaensis]|uniref:Uncharacterized protein n=1 Tax=Sphingomonas qomolangmaensis TaxID=2918765 RepID=A0ABY5L5V0_9SPHN|nr:hypothetical protein [Sphingomonas qomolangmaensis]UUL82152.1 hypothetical protein NMP03_13310 [Sphingomonas qomolangmaensis]